MQIPANDDFPSELPVIITCEQRTWLIGKQGLVKTKQIGPLEQPASGIEFSVPIQTPDGPVKNVTVLNQHLATNSVLNGYYLFHHQQRREIRRLFCGTDHKIYSVGHLFTTQEIGTWSFYQQSHQFLMPNYNYHMMLELI